MRAASAADRRDQPLMYSQNPPRAKWCAAFNRRFSQTVTIYTPGATETAAPRAISFGVATALTHGQGLALHATTICAACPTGNPNPTTVIQGQQHGTDAPGILLTARRDFPPRQLHGCHMSGGCARY